MLQSVELLIQAPEILVVTDPGIDDALAILVAASACPSSFFIATYGNGPITETSANLHGLTDFIKTNLRKLPGWNEVLSFTGSDRPIGAGNRWYPEFPGRNIHFIHGDGACEGRFNGFTPIKEKSGVIFSRLGKTGSKTDVFSFGAVTELVLMLKERAFAKKINSITIMGGAINSPGNVKPHVEANFRHDPDALKKIIMIANKRKIPLTIVPLDISQIPELEFTEDRAKWLVESLNANRSYKVSELINNLAGTDSTYSRFYRTKSGVAEINYPFDNRQFCGPIIHDLTALMIRLHPELFEFMEIPVKIDSDGEIGRTAVWMEKTGVVNIPVKLVNPKRYWYLIRDYLCFYN